MKKLFGLALLVSMASSLSALQRIDFNFAVPGTAVSEVRWADDSQGLSIEVKVQPLDDGVTVELQLEVVKDIAGERWVNRPKVVTGWGQAKETWVFDGPNGIEISLKPEQSEVKISDTAGL